MLRFSSSVGWRLIRRFKGDQAINQQAGSKESSIRLSKCLLNRISQYASRNPTPMNARKLTSFVKSDDNLDDSYFFTKREIPIRLAHSLQKMISLPDALKYSEQVQYLIGVYSEHFDRILASKYYDRKSEPKSHILSDFTDTLITLLEKNTNAVELMATAHGSFEQNLNEKDKQGDKADKSRDRIRQFLDEFFLYRVSIRVLCHEHMYLQMKGLEPISERHKASLVSEMNLEDTISVAVSEARRVCIECFGIAPGHNMSIFDMCPGKVSLVVKSPRKIKVTHIGCYLHHIVFELTKNAFMATIKRYPNQGDMPPVQFSIISSPEHVLLTVRDQGCGIPYHDLPRVFTYRYSSFKSNVDKLTCSKTSILSGLGYGLPLSRLYARYMNGDVGMTSVENDGTIAYVYLQANPERINETFFPSTY